MGTTPLAGYPYPDLTDPPNGPGQFLAALAAAERKDVLPFTTSTARDAAITSPAAGMLAYLSTPKQLTQYDGVGWVTVYEAPTAWTTLPFATNWGAGANGLKYRKVGDNVYLQGAAAWSGGTVGSATQLVGTLPVGYRPTAVRRFVAWQNNAGKAVRVTVDTSGQVSLDDSLANGTSWEISAIVSTVA